MTMTTDTNMLVIYGLVFLLGLLVGIFMTAGGRRKWKSRYESEIDRRRELEKTHADREKHWSEQERDWRERDSLRGAAARDRRDPADDRPL